MLKKKGGKMNQECQLMISFIKAFKGKKLDITVRLFLPPVVPFQVTTHILSNLLNVWHNQRIMPHLLLKVLQWLGHCYPPNQIQNYWEFKGALKSRSSLWDPLMTPSSFELHLSLRTFTMLKIEDPRELSVTWFSSFDIYY